MICRHIGLSVSSWAKADGVEPDYRQYARHKMLSTRHATRHHCQDKCANWNLGRFTCLNMMHACRNQKAGSTLMTAIELHEWPAGPRSFWCPIEMSRRHSEWCSASVKHRVSRLHFLINLTAWRGHSSRVIWSQDSVRRRPWPNYFDHACDKRCLMSSHQEKRIHFVQGGAVHALRMVCLDGVHTRVFYINSFFLVVRAHFFCVCLECCGDWRQGVSPCFGGDTQSQTVQGRLHWEIQNKVRLADDDGTALFTLRVSRRCTERDIPWICCIFHWLWFCLFCSMFAWCPRGRSKGQTLSFWPNPGKIRHRCGVLWGRCMATLLSLIHKWGFGTNVSRMAGRQPRTIQGVADHQPGLTVLRISGMQCRQTEGKPFKRLPLRSGDLLQLCTKWWRRTLECGSCARNLCLTF